MPVKMLESYQWLCCLINLYSTFPVTPWHNIAYLDTTSVSLSLSRKPTEGDVTYKVCKDDPSLDFPCVDVPMYSIMVEDANKQAKLLLRPQCPSAQNISSTARFNLEIITNIAKLHSPIIFEAFGSILYASEVADDFRRIAGAGLLLSILHQGIPMTTTATHYAAN